MSDLNAIAPQIARQPKPSANRFPSVQTSTQPKLRSILKILNERAVATDTADLNLKSLAAKIRRQNGKLPLGSTRLKGVSHQEETDRLRSGRTWSGVHRRTGFCQVTPPLGRKPAPERGLACFALNRPRAAR